MNKLKLLMAVAVAGMCAGAMAEGKTFDPTTGRHTFTIGDEAFLLDGKPFVIRCGEMHFARIPRPYWRHRLQMIRACGFNAVCAYMFWNNHERVRGQYDFTGDKDVAAFCRLAQEEGLWVVLRPGPYTCAEWDFGGMPWWLLKHDGIKLRSCDPRYLKPACAYLMEVGKVLRDCQVTRGGNILMVQVENEYGSYGNDAAFMRAQYEAVRAAGFDVPTFACNGATLLQNGDIPELFSVANFGSNPAEQLGILRKFRAKGPLMCGEYYPAWFDNWGEVHNVKDAAAILHDLEWMLKTNASFSVYMAHGGTTFAWWSGCNAPFRPQVSSYDYDAPISEAGWAHPTKFNALRALFAKYLNPGETLPKAPAAYPVQKGSAEARPQVASIRAAAIAPLATKEPLTFEKADLGYGFAVYSTTIPAGMGGELRADVRDLGAVLVDGETMGYFDRRYRASPVKIPFADRARRLDIIVEPLGRYNFGHIMHDAMKGIVGSVTLRGTKLTDWKMVRFNLAGDAMKHLTFGDLPAKATACAPGMFYRYRVKMEAKDTFLDMRAWKRGMVSVNGKWIGRYWSIGPTQTMHIPGCWLKDGENEIVVWDVVGVKEVPTTLTWRDQPILAEMRPETDYMTFQPRAKLAKPLANPVKEGEFANSAVRQDVRFEKPVTGRYFALEALDAWDGREFAACSELDLVDAKGQNIPHTLWSIAACSSEERRGEDGSADNLVDGQSANNHWHSEWHRAAPKPPHYFVIDLGKTETIGGFNFMPRQSHGAGRVRHYRTFVLPSVELTK